MHHLISIALALVAKPIGDDDSRRRYYAGTIGTLRIQMDLSYDGRENVTALYFYEKIGRPLKLRGKLPLEGSMRLDEFDADKRTGSFEGSLSQDGWSFEGTWRNTGSVTHPFHLKRVAQEETTRISRGSRLTHAFHRPVLSGSGVLVTHVNRSLESESDEMMQSGRKALGESTDSPCEYLPVNVLEEKVTLAYIDEDLISVRRLHIIDGGGAHANYGTGCATFWLENGNVRELRLADLFQRERFIGSLSKLVLEDLKRQEASRVSSGEECGLDEEDLRAFVLTPAGIEFSFGPYHMGSFAEGTYVVTVPYPTVKGLLDPRGPTARFVK